MRHAILLPAVVVLLASSVALAVECPVCGAKNLDAASVCEECKSPLPIPKAPVVKPAPPAPSPAPAAPTASAPSPAPAAVAPPVPAAQESTDELPVELRPGYAPSRRTGPMTPLTTTGPDGLEEEERLPDPGSFDPKNFASQRGTVTFGEIDDVAIAKAIRAGVASLSAQQRVNGSWEPYGNDPKFFNYQLTGPTAMAVYTLIESGVRVEDDRVKKALAWLSAQSETRTYSLGLRACAYAAAYRKAGGEQKGQLRRLLRADVDQLVAATIGGAYGYYSSPKHAPGRWDNSNSQYGVLGVWAAAMVGMEVPEKYWQLVAGHWARTQARDGGWGYAADASRGTMTVAGLATLMVCYEQVMGPRFLTCGASAAESARLEAGLRWLVTNFGQPLQGVAPVVAGGAAGAAKVPPAPANPATAPAPGGGAAPGVGGAPPVGGGPGIGGLPPVVGFVGGEWWYYYWYGVERVGLASGMKYFGKVDWYKEGAAKLVPSGAWRMLKLHDTCFTLLFLIRGRRPVIFNHLQYKGDWNNRPQALANLTRWLSDNFEHAVSWQNISVEAPVTEWHDAPILTITGARKPSFAPAELDKLRTYVAQGGVIFSMTECNGAEFDKGMRAIYKTLFPNYEFTRAGPNHEIFTSRTGFNVSADTPVYVMSNGMRPLVIHTDQDWVKSWQACQTVSEQASFAVAGSLVHHVMLDTKTMAYPRGQSAWPMEETVLPMASIKIARLQHGGNYDPEPLAIKRFALLGRIKDGIAVEPTDPMPVSDLAASKARVATLVSTGSISLSDKEVVMLKDFVTGGGTLLIEGAGGNESFQKSALDLVGKMFPGQAPQLLPPDHRLYKTGVWIKSVAYRPKTIRRVGRADTPRLMGLSVEGKIRVLISPEDITGGLLGVPYSSIDGYRPQSAQAIMRNILAYAYLKSPDPTPK